MTGKESNHLRLSYSSMGVFNSCARKFEFRKFYPEAPREESFAASVGTALHHAYQHFLIHRDADKARFELMMTFPHKNKYIQPSNLRYIPSSIYDPKRDYWASLAILEEMIANDFINDFELAQITNHEGKVVPAIEVPFEINFPGIFLGPKENPMTVSYIGFIDAILRNKKTGMYRTTDIKTHRSTSSRRDAEFQYSGQQVPYGLVLQHILNESVDQFEVHYFDCYVSLLTPRVDNWVFTKDKKYMQEWLTGMILKLRQLDTYMKMDFFPRREQGCLSYMRPCFFLNLCQLRNREKLLKLWHAQVGEGKKREHKPWIVCDLQIPKELL